MYQLLRARTTTKGGWWYWLDDHGVLHDLRGAFSVVGEYDVVAINELAGDWDELDWSDTNLCREGTDSGWVSPSGEFFGCPANGHDRFARFVLHKKVLVLEQGGWVRVYSTPAQAVAERRRAHDAWCCQRSLTPEQRRWLEAHGHEVRDHD